MKWVKGKVRWFDNRFGEGLIRVGEKSIYVHYSAIDRDDDNKPLDKDFYWRILFSGQDVLVKVLDDHTFIQIESVK